MRIEVGHLRAGVNAAIGASGGRYCDRLAGDCGQRSLERILHRAAARLGLPAEKAAAVVLQSYGDAGN